MSHIRRITKFIKHVIGYDLAVTKNRISKKSNITTIEDSTFIQ